MIKVNMSNLLNVNCPFLNWANTFKHSHLYNAIMKIFKSNTTRQISKALSCFKGIISINTIIKLIIEK